MNIKKFIIVIFLVSLFIYYLVNLWQSSNKFNYHTDEHEFVRRAGLYFSLFLQGRLLDKQWNNFLAYDNAQLPYFFYGLALYLQGFNTNMQTKLISFDSGYNTNINKDYTWLNQCGENRCPNKSQEIKDKLIPIIKARKIAVLISFGTLILIFVLGYKLSGYILGSLFTIFLWKNSLFQDYAVSSMSEAPLLFFLVLTLLLSFIYIESYLKQKKNSYKYLILCSISAGLASANKLTGIISWIYIIILVFIITILNLIRKKRNLNKNILFIKNSFFYCLVLLLPFFIFIVFNPFTWNNPIKNVVFMINHRSKIVHYQQTHLYAQATLYNSYEKYAYFFQGNLLTSNYLGILKTKYIPTDLILLILGLISLISRIYLKIKKYKTLNKEILIILWFSIFLFTLNIYLPIKWTRYCFPMIPSLVIIEPYGLLFLIKYFNKDG